MPDALTDMAKKHSRDWIRKRSGIPLVSLNQGIGIAIILQKVAYFLQFSELPVLKLKVYMFIEESYSMM